MSFIQKKALFSLIFICLVQYAFSQDFYVNLKGDTIGGYILKPFKNTHARKMTFKIIAESNTEDVLSPQQVRSFRAGSTFISYVVNLETGQESLFMQSVLKGTISLYKVVDENGKPDFFIQKNNEVLPVDKLNMTAFIENYFTDCPKFDKSKYLPANIDSYRQEFLMDIVSAYNACSSPNSAYIPYYTKPTIRPKDDIRFGLKVGAGVQEFAYRSFGSPVGASFYGTTNFKFAPTVALGVYGSIEYSKIFSVRVEAMYLYRNAKSDDKVIDLRFSGLNVPVVLEFKFLNKKTFSSFVNVGGNTVIAIAQRYTIGTGGGGQLLRPLSISPISFGILGGVGAYFGAGKTPIKVELRGNQDFFEANNASIGDDKMRSIGIQLLVSYPLK